MKNKIINLPTHTAMGRAVKGKQTQVVFNAVFKGIFYSYFVVFIFH